MPQATDELRAYWGGVDDTPAYEHLKRQGFIDHHDWTWTKPSPDYVLSERDWNAIEFLIDEWDWGGLRKEEEPPRHG